MKKVFILFVIPSLLINCKQNSNKSIEVNTTVYEGESCDFFESDTLETNNKKSFPNPSDELNYQLEILSNAKQVNAKHIGIAGSTNKEYMAFEFLKKEANPQLLLSLIYHENPVTRAYAFDALLETDSARAHFASEILANDTATINTMSGCTIFSLQVRDYVNGKYFHIENANVD